MGSLGYMQALDCCCHVEMFGSAMVGTVRTGET
jgi:hypothetical protein